MVAFPPCKINLGLNIIRRRDDGYHDIETCFYPVPWTDILEIIPSNEFSFNATGNAIPGNGDDNLCIRAWQLLKTPPVKIHLHKIIPIGAGLGGGSSDAAWTLRLLNDAFQLGLKKEELRHYASQLGSDCAFFIDDIPMMGTGRGEMLRKADISLNGKFIVIVKPDVHVSTAQAYAGIIPKEGGRTAEQIPIEEWKIHLKNDFESTVPDKLSLKQRFYDLGALYASMSGSGSAVYGIFSKRVDYEKVFPGTICYSCWL